MAIGWNYRCDEPYPGAVSLSTSKGPHGPLLGSSVSACTMLEVGLSGRRSQFRGPGGLSSIYESNGSPAKTRAHREPQGLSMISGNRRTISFVAASNREANQSTNSGCTCFGTQIGHR